SSFSPLLPEKNISNAGLAHYLIKYRFWAANLDYNSSEEDSFMWPLMIVLLFTGVAPQQGQSNADGAYIGKIPQIKSLLGTVPQAKSFSGHSLQVRRVSPEE